MEASASRPLIRIFLLSAGLSLMGLVLPRSVLEVIAQAFPLRHVADLVPAVEILARVSVDPAYYHFIIALQWLFVPLYFCGFCIAGRIWDSKHVASELKRIFVQSRHRFKVAAGQLMFFMIVLSDIFHLNYPSFYWGDSLAAYHNNGIFLAINNVRPFGACFYLSIAVIEALQYFFVIQVCVAIWHAIKVKSRR